MKDWERDGELKISLGQSVADDVVNQLINCVPPAYHSHTLFQVGEAKDHDLQQPDRKLYDTFEQSALGWVYRGTCLLGKTEHRKGYIETLYAMYDESRDHFSQLCL